MNRIQKAWAALTGQNEGTKALTQRPPRNVPLEIPITVINGQIVSSTDNKLNYVEKGYSHNDIVYSITSSIANKVRMAPWSPYKVTNDAAAKKYAVLLSKKNWTGGEFQELSNLRKKAFEPYDNDEFLNTLLSYPNEYQTFSDLVADSSIMKMISGDRFIYTERLSGGANEGKFGQMHIIPTQDVSILIDRTKWPLKVVGYSINSFNIKNIEANRVIHDKYYNPNSDVNGLHLYGLSPLKAAHSRLDRSNAETLAATAAYHNGGPKGIIFVDDMRFDATQSMAQVNAVKEKLQGSEYIGPNNNNKIAASGYKMDYKQVGSSPADLEINQSEWSTLRMLCNVWEAPSQIFNDPENKTYNSLVEAEKAFTSRCALPLLNSFRNSFNKYLDTHTSYKGKKIILDYDLTVYSELQENLKEKWSWVERLPVTNGYKLDLMGLDHPEGQDEFMNQILVPSGYELSDTFGESETDRALADGDEEIPEDER